MKKWVMILLVILASACTGVGYYYYNYIYRAPANVKNREFAETNLAYEYLVYDSKERMVKNKYDYKVLINPVGGGHDSGLTAGALRESEVALSVARYVESLNEDAALGIFMTRDTDTDPTYEQRLSMIETVDPDMIIELRLTSSDDPEIMGTSILYDEEYYDPHLVNSDLADMMERSIIDKTEGRAEGIFALQDGVSDYIKTSHRPSVVIKMGYVSNSKEAEALLSETYRSNIALGILGGIDSARHTQIRED